MDTNDGTIEFEVVEFALASSWSIHGFGGRVGALCVRKGRGGTGAFICRFRWREWRGVWECHCIFVYWWGNLKRTCYRTVKFHADVGKINVFVHEIIRELECTGWADGCAPEFILFWRARSRKGFSWRGGLLYWLGRRSLALVLDKRLFLQEVSGAMDDKVMKKP